MNSSQQLQTYTYPDTTPKGLVRKMALRGINRLLLLRGLKFPPYFAMRADWPTWSKGRNRIFNDFAPNVKTGDDGDGRWRERGLLTRLFCRQVGKNGRVFAFEPDPLTFQFLEFNTRSFGNKELTQCAVSDNHEPALLHLNFMSGAGNSLLNRSQSTESVPVTCISLDEFLKQHGNPVVDVIKIDVEGAELSVLRGMRQTMARLPGIKLIIEYCPKNLNGAGVAPRSLR